MKNRNTQGLCPWSPGESGNPKGRPPNILPREVESAAREDLQRAIKFLFTVSVADAQRIAKSKNGPALLVWLAKVLTGAGRRGDFFVFDRLLDRVIGRPK